MEMTTKISDDTPSIATVQIEEKDGKVIKKDILFSDYLDLLNRSKGTANSYYRLGGLPAGFYDGSISQQHDHTFKAIIIVNPKRLPCKYFESEYIIPFPKSAFFFHVNRKRVTETKIFALKQHGGQGECERLCHFPFPNIYADGRVCWGANRLPEIQQIKESEQLVSLFFSTPFNHDLFGASKGKWDCVGSTAFDIFERLQQMDSFPEEVLVPCRDVSLDDLLK